MKHYKFRYSILLVISMVLSFSCYSKTTVNMDKVHKLYSSNEFAACELLIQQILDDKGSDLFYVYTAAYILANIKVQQDSILKAIQIYEYTLVEAYSYRYNLLSNYEFMEVNTQMHDFSSILKMLTDIVTATQDSLTAYDLLEAPNDSLANLAVLAIPIPHNWTTYQYYMSHYNGATKFALNATEPSLELYPEETIKDVLYCKFDIVTDRFNEHQSINNESEVFYGKIKSDRNITEIVIDTITNSIGKEITIFNTLFSVNGESYRFSRAYYIASEILIKGSFYAPVEKYDVYYSSFTDVLKSITLPSERYTFGN